MKEEDKVYRKVGRKYIPIGLHERIEWLSDGFINIERHSFPEVKWEDKKPTKVKLIIEKV